MKYQFDKVVDRRNTNSLKWDVTENELPMWVADMDFETAPEIIDALHTRVNHGVFGYNIIPDEWNRAYQDWWSRRHHFEIESEWMIFATGVVPILSSVVRKLTTPGENVLIQTPVYNIFFNSILNNGRNVLESPLHYENGEYSIDFADLEEKLANPQTSMMILCNPHNPVGKIWSREELARIGELCKKYNVIVVSDEIHCDLTAPDKEYIPFAAVSETCKDISVTCIAPTKAFNIAGLQSAAAVVPNPFLRHKVWRGLNTDEVAEPNSFAIQVAVAAFTQGEDWLNELREYVQENKYMVRDFLAENIPEFQIISYDVTYLLWIDCSKITENSLELAKFLRKETGLFLTAGTAYGESGRHFLRLNIACPKATLEDGLKRLLEGVRRFQNR